MNRIGTLTLPCRTKINKKMVRDWEAELDACAFFALSRSWVRYQNKAARQKNCTKEHEFVRFPPFAVPTGSPVPEPDAALQGRGSKGLGGGSYMYVNVPPHSLFNNPCIAVLSSLFSNSDIYMGRQRGWKKRERNRMRDWNKEKEGNRQSERDRGKETREERERRPKIEGRDIWGESKGEKRGKRESRKDRREMKGEPQGKTQTGSHRAEKTYSREKRR